MNIQDLIEALQDIAIENPDAEVQIVQQPGYPLLSNIAGLGVDQGTVLLGAAEASDYATGDQTDAAYGY